MAVSKSNLNFLLTSDEPLLAQSHPAQSIGGYISITQLSASAILTNDISPNGTSLPLSASLSGTSALIDEEIVNVSSGTTTLTLSQRQAFNTSGSFHLSGTLAYALNKSSLFNNSLNSDGKQYRCIAVKNTHATDIFYDLAFYIKHNSTNPDCTIKMAVEVPATEILHGLSTSGTTISVVKNSLINAYANNAFVGNVIYFESGLNIGLSRVIASFDSKTGTFTFTHALPYVVTTNTLFRIEQAPSTRINSGSVAPGFGLGRITSLSLADNIDGAIDINTLGLRSHGSDLYPNEVVYLWLERSLQPNVDKYENNRVIFTASYETT